MYIDKDVLEKVLQYRRSKGQRGMILTYCLSSGRLIKWKFVYDRKLM